MAHELLNNNYTNFWNDIKKLSKKVTKLPNSINNTSGDYNIAELFREKYYNLYNCSTCSPVEMLSIKQEISQGISHSCLRGQCYHNHNVDVNCVSTAIKLLKKGKSDGTCNITTDHLINGSGKLVVYLSLLFNCMIKHGSVPSGFLESQIVPIPKNKRKSLNDISNYRGIAVSSVIGKILDSVIIHLHESVLQSCDMQFGFKKGHSTTQCTAIVEEVVNYYKNRNSSVYVLMLDASQAFDRVNYKSLFCTLLNRGLCFLTTRLLFNLYNNQLLSIKWGNCISTKFKPSNGVKQGGVLSPLLFTLYIDNLFTELKHCGFGCYIGNLFSGAFGYADDIVLLAPTVFSLNKLYSICKQYGHSHNIVFNPQKSKLLIFGSDIQGFVIDNNFLTCQPTDKHVGHVIGPSLVDQDIKSKINEMVINTNHLVSTFRNASYDIKYKLFKTFAMPLYGCVLWDYSSVYIEKLFVCWRKCIRRLLSVPYNTHSILLPIICSDLPIECQLHKRVMKFFICLAKSNNIYNNLALQLIVEGSKSRMSNSLNYICYKYGICKYDLSNVQLSQLTYVMKHLFSTNVDVDTLVYADVIIDMLSFIDQNKFNIFTPTQTRELLSFACTI